MKTTIHADGIKFVRGPKDTFKAILTHKGDALIDWGPFTLLGDGDVFNLEGIRVEMDASVEPA